MIYGQNIICHALPTWEGDYMKAVVQLMAQLAKNNRVIYVNYAYTYKDLIGGILGKNNTPVKKVLGTKGRLFSKIKHENGELFILYPPPVMPTNFINNPAVDENQQHKQAQKIGKTRNKAQKQLGFENAIVINAFNPQFGLPLVGKLNERLTLYYCYDEINAAAWCKVHGGRVEQEFMQKVNGVIVTSEGLLKTKSQCNQNCFLVKNGVDHPLFSTAIEKEIKSDKIIGYIGSIDDRIDYELLSKVSKTFASYKLKLIGRVTHEPAYDFAKAHKNVDLTGSKQPLELAAELKEVDLGLIPFITNEFTRNIYPLKVNEYLAAGKAVVSTNFAPLGDFSSQITIANDHFEFITGINNELNNDSVEKRLARNQFAKANSWENRAETFSQIINDLLLATNETD